MVHTIDIRTNKRNQMIDITSEIQRIISNNNISDGICVIYTTHTTAAITINENADPCVVTDMLNGLEKIAPAHSNYTHMEGNSDSHIKSSLFGCSETIIIENGKLLLGIWQGIYFCEFDGPRNRKALVKIIES